MIVAGLATCKIIEFGDWLTSPRDMRERKMERMLMQTQRVILKVLMGFWCNGGSLGGGGSELKGMD